MYRDLALADVSAEDEEAMWSLPVREWRNAIASHRSVPPASPYSRRLSRHELSLVWGAGQEECLKGHVREPFSPPTYGMSRLRGYESLSRSDGEFRGEKAPVSLPPFKPPHANVPSEEHVSGPRTLQQRTSTGLGRWSGCDTGEASAVRGGPGKEMFRITHSGGFNRRRNPITFECSIYVRSAQI
jgi:hypothetical protein